MIRGDGDFIESPALFAKMRVDITFLRQTTDHYPHLVVWTQPAEIVDSTFSESGESVLSRGLNSAY
jgi:hypothetical protein